MSSRPLERHSTGLWVIPPSAVPWEGTQPPSSPMVRSDLLQHQVCEPQHHSSSRDPSLPQITAMFCPPRATHNTQQGRVSYLEGVLLQGAHHLPEGDLGSEGVAVVHHGFPVWPVPAIHLQAPAAPFQSPRGGLSLLGQHTSHVPSLLPLGVTPTGTRGQPPRVGGMLHAGQVELSSASPLLSTPWCVHRCAGSWRMQRSFYVCPMELPRAQLWDRRVLGGN